MELITGLGSATHITALQDAFWHRGIWSSNCILKVGNNLNPSIISNNEIQIQSGIGSVQGRFFIVEPNTYDSVTINNGTVGENRIDLIVAQYQKNEETQVESMTWEVIQGTPSADTPVAPSYTQGNIDNGDVLVQFPVFQVNLNGINIESVDTLLNVESAFTEAIQVKRVKLFDGAVKTGSLTLNDSLSKYRMLIFNINIESSGSPFGYGIYPILNNTSIPQNVIIGDTTAQNNHSTYMGKVKQVDDTTISVTLAFSNVRHITRENHGGASQYFIREVWGIS